VAWAVSAGLGLGPAAGSAAGLSEAPSRQAEVGKPLVLKSAVEDPEASARAYLGAVEGMAWEAVVHRVHPETAESFRRYLEVMLFQDADPSELTGREEEATLASGLSLADALQAVSGARSVSAYLELDDRAVLMEAFRALQRDSPGMINAWVDRSTEVLGVVPEGDTLRHVVYRLEWRITGARADIEVLTLAAGPDGEWLVRRARELESLRPAISAIFRRPPPGTLGQLGSEAEAPEQETPW
jgi:hypothetical protein